MKKYFKDFYGCTASISQGRSGVTLTIRTGAGTLVTRKTYATERGAKIAMGRHSDGWRPA